MAEYNPSKIIKDGNTYNFRDNTKIPLAGSNQISGSLIPATTNAYDLGSSSYQWNNAYIKSLTINGVACGDILTHNASEFVDVTTAQIIDGLKTFRTNGCKFYKQVVINHDLLYSKDNPPSPSAYHNLMFTDASGWWGGYIENVTDTSGNSTLRFYVRNTNENQSSVVFRSGIDNSYSMIPINNNVWDLGSSTNKWKTINGVEPSALSLQGTPLINVASSITALDGSASNTFTPQVNGWLLINGTGPANEGFIYVKQGRIGMVSATNSVTLRCATLIPVVAGVEVTVTCKLGSLTWANIAPCQGNV